MIIFVHHYLRCAPGITNPIEAAAVLAKTARSSTLSGGRVRPVFMAGDGARIWALEQGLSCAQDPESAVDWNVTDNSRQTHSYYLKMIQGSNNNNQQVIESDDLLGGLGDTIGVVIICRNKHNDASSDRVSLAARCENII